jgi:hypothetical protein
MAFFFGAVPGDAVREKGFREVVEGVSGDSRGDVECVEERIIVAAKEESNWGKCFHEILYRSLRSECHGGNEGSGKSPCIGKTLLKEQETIFEVENYIQWAEC